jgi:hypothetical protein
MLFLSNCGIERFLKKVLGRNDVEDALARLDVLTKEEDLMVAARTLNVVHRLDDNVTVIKGNVKDAIELTRHVDRGVTEIKDDIGDVGSNVKANTELIHHVDNKANVIDAGIRGVSSDVKEMKSGK